MFDGAMTGAIKYAEQLYLDGYGKKESERMLMAMYRSRGLSLDDAGRIVSRVFENDGSYGSGVNGKEN